MSARHALLVLLLGAAAVLSGTWLGDVRREEGSTPSAAQIPLGGFEPLAVNLLWLRAEAMRREGRFPEAAANFRAVTNLQPEIGEASALAAHLLAWTRTRDGDTAKEWEWVREAVRILDRGLAHSPDSKPVLLELGFIWLYRVGRNDALRALAEKDLGHLPEEEAVATFRRLFEVDPSKASRGFLADAAYRLGERERDEKRWKPALEAYRIALPLYRDLATDPEMEGLRPLIKEVEGKINDCEARLKGD